MIDISSAELSMISSRVLGLPYSHAALRVILDALLAARNGRGPRMLDGSDLLKSPKMDDASLREVLLRRLRMVASRAAKQTTYYSALFSKLGIDPDRLTWEDMSHIPVTPKSTVRERPYDFVARDAVPTFRSTTNGTTGRPTSISFSAYEIETSILLSAINNLMIGDFLPEDIALISQSARATLGNLVNGEAVRRVGAMVIMGGQVDPEYTLAMLAEKHDIPGKASQVSFFAVYPSYLGDLVEVGLRLGYRPSDFALRRIDLGGEVVTAGVKRRAKELFGDVPYYEGFGMTETWSVGGVICPSGHMHYNPVGAIREFISVDTGEPAKPGELATIVATPLPPSRDTTLLIRYDTQDLVRVLERPDCPHSSLPAVSHPLGKLDLAVKHEKGWTTPRDVLEALEAVDYVPLPARCGFWEVAGGLAVEVVVRGDENTARRAILESLEECNVPVAELILRTGRTQLERPYPFRGDLRETSFGVPTLPPATRAKSNGHKVRSKRSGKGA